MTTPNNRHFHMTAAHRMAKAWVASTLLLVFLLGCGNGTSETAADPPPEPAQAAPSEEGTDPDPTLEQDASPEPETAATPPPDQEHEPEPDADEEDVSTPDIAGEAAALLHGVEYRVGDCFVHTDEDAEPSASPGQVVPCNEPHDGEIFAIDDQMEPGVWPEVDMLLANYVGVAVSEVDDWVTDAGLTIGIWVEFTGGPTGVGLIYLAPIAEGDKPLIRSYRAS